MEPFSSPVLPTVRFGDGDANLGWCFSLRQFAEIYAPIYGINKAKLVQYMWGDYVFNPKTKKVSTWKPTDAQSPIFVKMVLSTIWKVYKSVWKRDEDSLHSIIETAQISLSPAEFNTQDDALLVKLILSRWFPLYKAVLSRNRMGVSFIESVVKLLPSPIEAQSQRYEMIWDPVVRKQSRHTLRF